MAERKQCQFQLIRYVPDPVRNEFVNIGVLLRGDEEPVELRLTRDWSRVRCLQPDADIRLLEGLELEVSQRLRAQPGDLTKPILTLLEDSLSHTVQITDAKGYLAESFVSAIEDLMRRFVDAPPRRERSQRLGGRAALRAAIRTQFELAGVWGLMQKSIAAAKYTRPGDPLRIECGYRNGKLKMFQPVSLETNADDAKLLAFTAPGLTQGVERVEGLALELTAIIEPLAWPATDAEPEEERAELYQYANAIMTEQGIRVMSTSRLPEMAQTARAELHV